MFLIFPCIWPCGVMEIALLPGVIQGLVVTVRQFETSSGVCSRFKHLLRFWQMDLSLPGVVHTMAVTVRDQLRHRSSSVGRCGFVVQIGWRCCGRWSLPHDWGGDSSSIWSCSWSCWVWKHQFLIGGFGTGLLYKPMYWRLERWRDRSEGWKDSMKCSGICSFAFNISKELGSSISSCDLHLFLALHQWLLCQTRGRKDHGMSIWKNAALSLPCCVKWIKLLRVEPGVKAVWRKS